MKIILNSTGVLLFCFFLSVFAIFDVAYPQIIQKSESQILDHKISFTYDSPSNPWTTNEISILQNFLSKIYPLAVEIYGHPYVAGNVNIKKDPLAVPHGEYDYSTNEITIRSINDLTSLCHEVLHAFRDDLIIPFDVFEEGMVRAAEIEIYNRMPEKHPWNEAHSYFYDYYYEALNKNSISTLTNKFPGNTLILLRYQMSSYAWAKILIEDPGFFTKFNSAYYSEFSQVLNYDSLYTDLLNLVVGLKNSVEDVPTKEWIEKQHIFNITSIPGLFILQRMNSNDVDAVAFDKDIFGSESLFNNKRIFWEFFDYNNNMIENSINYTNNNGWVSKPIKLSPDYSGRLKIISSYQVENRIVSDTVFRAIGKEEGIFGTVKFNLNGKVVVTYLDSSKTQESQIINGVFSFPEFENKRGKFKIEYINPEGETISKIITKDASKYYVLIDDGAILSSVKKNESSPLEFNLKQNFPNPFNSSTKIEFSIPNSGDVNLEIFNMLGQKIKTVTSGYLEKGNHSTELDLKDHSSGIYIYRLRYANFLLSKKMSYLK